jgi:hypothetical protein
MLALMKPKNTVTISIIGTVLAPLCGQKRHARRTVKRISDGVRNLNRTDDLEQHRVSQSEVS